MSDVFDYVIVGGGTAAGILAYRLGEAGHSVCVLEAGPSDRRYPVIQVPAGFMKTLFDPRVTFQLQSDPDPASDNRAIPYTQGRTLGGSSSVNGMVHNRGNALDFDTWAQMGNRGWSYTDVLPYFRRTETRIGEEVNGAFRGNEGRLPVTTSPWDSPVCDAFVAAAQQCGHPFNVDTNGETQAGVGYYQSAIRKGRRYSTATAYLHPARKAFGTDVRTHALATKILFEDRMAVGVAYRRGGAEAAVKARREVILCCGTVQSPKLLQLSGVGPSELLNDHGIRPLHALPGVGENFRDHYSPRLVMRAKPGVDSLNALAKGFPLVGQIARWLVGRPSILALSPALVHVFGKSDRAMDYPDYSLVFTPASYKAGFIGKLDDYPGMTCGAWVMRPRSSGYVRIASNDPMVMPRLNARYLTDHEDQRVLIAGLRAARAIFATDPIASMIETELFPGSDYASDSELLNFARAHGNSSYHLVGTCKMGPATDAMAVVDPQLRLHGLQSLRVIDASIMPTMPSANTAASTMMIAEKGADLILGKTLA
jgi:choline dehydrogenase